jgi:hypothetical protein
MQHQMQQEKQTVSAQSVAMKEKERKLRAELEAQMRSEVRAKMEALERNYLTKVQQIPNMLESLYQVGGLLCHQLCRQLCQVCHQLCRQLHISPISRHFETTRNSEICAQRREIHRDIGNFGITCGFEIT